ncbi:hypothetical protein FGG08_005898 [Glutinoglossum americanum]|uniref:[histone H3]-dimethyl-L-lysine(36) demethylase n=1 Tax=Glutinoglossum americanum TaxID=1670608 RepID=A0A9P8I4M7_9PEZI|nr:hypothetical protein FGG08_005898 [Glutinoglossum americanum]
MANSDNGSGEGNVTSRGSHQMISGRKRGATGHGQRNSRKRKEIETASKRRAKDLKDSILKSEITWGDYNANFPARSMGEVELHDFLLRIEKVSTFAKIRDDTFARLLSKLREKSSKLDILTQLQSDLCTLPQDDVILLTDEGSLSDALNWPFQVPLLHRATKDSPSLAPRTNFGIPDLLKHFADYGAASISVYDYSVPDPTQRTRQTTVHELLSCFPSERACCTALNFLDIENRTQIQFCPSSIILQDITAKLDALKEHDKGKTGSKWKAEPRKEFFLLSMKNAISTIHVDTGGAVTWVLILAGRKIWYFPRHVSPRTVRWLDQAGSQTPENYPSGWVKVELRPGDLFVMPPSFPHAVFTPDDCLAVGGQIYTAGNLGRSIEGIKLQEDYPDISNEDLDDSVYSTLARVLRECGPFTSSLEKAEIVTSQTLFPHLIDTMTYDDISRDGLMGILKSLGVAIPSKAKKNELLELLKKNHGTQVACTPREDFLKALRELCSKFMADII